MPSSFGVWGTDLPDTAVTHCSSTLRAGGGILLLLWCFSSWCSAGQDIYSVHKTFGSGNWKRRIVALLAAYALVLSALIATFGSAREAAASPAIPGLITCHTDTAGTPSPAGDTNGKLCADSCCIGCLMLMADLPPPPDVAVGRPQSSGQRLTLPAAIDFAWTQQIGSHRSRGPPRGA